MYRSRGSCDDRLAVDHRERHLHLLRRRLARRGCRRGGLDTTIFRSGFTASCAFSPCAQMHGAAHLVERLARRLARLLAALGDDIAHQLGILLEFLRRAGACRSPPRRCCSISGCLQSRQPMPARAAALARPLARGLVGIDLVQVPHRALVRDRPGSVRRTRAGSVCMVAQLASPPTPAPRAARWCCRRTWTSCGRRAPAPSGVAVSSTCGSGRMLTPVPSR